MIRFSSSPGCFYCTEKISSIVSNFPQRHSCRNSFVKYNLLSLPSLYVYECCLYISKNQHKFVKNNDVRQKHSTKKSLSSCLEEKQKVLLKMRAKRVIPGKVTIFVLMSREIKLLLIVTCLLLQLNGLKHPIRPSGLVTFTFFSHHSATFKGFRKPFNYK